MAYTVNLTRHIQTFMQYTALDEYPLRRFSPVVERIARAMVHGELIMSLLVALFLDNDIEVLSTEHLIICSVEISPRKLVVLNEFCAEFGGTFLILFFGTGSGGALCTFETMH